MAKATVKRGSKTRLKSVKEAKRDVGKAAKATSKKAKPSKRMVDYPISDTLQWVADGEKLLIKWGAIKSPGAKRIANTVASVLSVLQALTDEISAPSDTMIRIRLTKPFALLPEAQQGGDANARRMLHFFAATRERYLATSTRSRRVVAPAGSGHNFIYEESEWTISVMRELICRS